MLLLCLVELRQTIPESGSVVCPGTRLQYTCSATIPPVGLYIGPSETQFLFPVGADAVNTSHTIGNFVAVLTLQNGTLSSFTATNEMVTYSYNGQEFGCVGGSSSKTENITLAGTVYIYSIHLLGM